MTSSSYCELSFERTEPDRTAMRIEGVVVESWQIPVESGFSPILSPRRPTIMTLRRGQSKSLLRVRIETDEVFRLPPHSEVSSIQLSHHLREQYGLADLVVEEASSDEPETWSTVLTMTLRMEADPAFQRLQEAIVRELEEVHLDLARDVVSRTYKQRGVRRVGEVRSFSAEDDLRELDDLYRRLERPLLAIAEQPSRTLERVRQMARWRPGDAISSAAAHRMAIEGSVRVGLDGRFHPPPKALVDRAVLATDIEEHRQIRSALLRLSERSAALARYSSRALDALDEERHRWSGPALEEKTRAQTVFLERIRSDAEIIQERYRKLLGRLAYLDGLGPPRTALRPTPIFLGRRSYREAFRVLHEARRASGGRFDSGPLRVRFRNLATLYEYWLFVRVVGLLRETFGAPVGDGAFTLIDEVYRPDLAPGQAFRFRLPRDMQLVARYEPDFPPVRDRSRRDRFRSALTTGVLRPDVTLELSTHTGEPVILILDAKSGPRMSHIVDRIQEASRYAWLIHDPRTGHQPVRHVFLVHRDREAAEVANLTGYFEGRMPPPETRVLGAVHAEPGETERLREVILRFVDTFRPRRSLIREPAMARRRTQETPEPALSGPSSAGDAEGFAKEHAERN